MKKTFTSSFLGLVISGLLLASCSQLATYENEDLILEQTSADKAGFKLSPFGSNGGNENAALTNCNNCIEEPQIAMHDVTKSTGNPSNPTITKHGDLSVWNTKTDLIVTFSFNGTDGADQITQTINGTIYSWSKDGAKDAAFTEVVLTANGKIRSYKITQALGEKTKCTPYSINFSSNGGPGGSLAKSAVYNIYEYCQNCDEETFTYSAAVTGTDQVNVVFTYDAIEALTNAEVKFTFPQIKNISQDGVYLAPDGKSYTVNNNGNNTVFTWRGNIGCSDETAVTFEFEVMAECNSSGKAQVWTSASINGNEIKNDQTPNIRFNCRDQSIELSIEG